MLEAERARRSGRSHHLEVGVEIRDALVRFLAVDVEIRDAVVRFLEEGVEIRGAVVRFLEVERSRYAAGSGVRSARS